LSGKHWGGPRNPDEPPRIGHLGKSSKGATGKNVSHKREDHLGINDIPKKKRRGLKNVNEEKGNDMGDWRVEKPVC